jgi:hypothetical protein
MSAKKQVTGSYRTVRRFTLVGAALSAFLVIDGLVLFATGGLSSDATPVFPVLGGSFASASRSSGTNLIIIGVIMSLVTLAGWWRIGRPLRAAERRDRQSPPEPAAPARQAGPEAAAVPRDDR